MGSEGLEMGPEDGEGVGGSPRGLYPAGGVWRIWGVPKGFRTPRTGGAGGCWGVPEGRGLELSPEGLEDAGRGWDR